jgi:hypothetical protein
MKGAERVQWYRLEWDTEEKLGTVVLVIPGKEREIIGLEPDEFHAISTMLRNERPIFWDEQARTILTGNEVVGEEEID